MSQAGTGISVDSSPAPASNMLRPAVRVPQASGSMTTSMPGTVPRMDATFEFSADLYEWDARDDASWVFVTLPADLAEDIQDMALPMRGFGSVKVRVRCGSSEWRTSVFPDSKSGSYVLPLKKAVRTKERLEIGATAAFEIDIAPE